jgi:prepilin-type N-terminal cleavage/methylation domain-containing protein
MEWQQMGTGMSAFNRGERGFSLIETVIALGVMTVGLLGAAAALSLGMQAVASSPGDLIATQKAAEAIESVYSARDSHVVTWAQLQNVKGASGSDGGIFLDGPQPIKLAGPDGLVNTADDATQPVESMVFPGPDQIMGTSDDVTVTLNGYTREIQIRNIENSLRSINVIVTYQVGPRTRTYTLTAYISNYS